ncbi:MAG: serine--tRNA ligase, partial [Limnochordia bacterium]|nr:serine--tRNA ligase [Limnochordia bacterium]
MLDLKMIRQNPDKVREGLGKKGEDTQSVDALLVLDERRRSILTDVEKLKAERNKVSEQVARLKREKQDAQSLIEEMSVVSRNIKDFDEELRTVDGKIQDLLL